MCLVGRYKPYSINLSSIVCCKLTVKKIDATYEVCDAYSELIWTLKFQWNCNYKQSKQHIASCYCPSSKPETV